MQTLCRKRKVEGYFFVYTSLQKKVDESVTNYIIRTETVLTALKNVGQTVDDAVVIAMILKGLYSHFNPFSIYETHSNKELMFSEFKTELYSFEEALKHKDQSSSDYVMTLTSTFSRTTMRNDNRNDRDTVFYM